MRKHFSSCTANVSVKWSNRELEVQSDMIAGNVLCAASQALINQEYPIIKNDETSRIAKEDHLIVNLGNQWLMRNRRNEIMGKYYTSSMMRLSAKLKVACRK